MPISQERSGKISWRLWRKAMSIWATDNTLKEPLGESVSWSPSESFAPFHVETEDGAISWHGSYCHGVVCELIPPTISTFESYIDSSDSWEMECLQEVDMVYSCHEIIDMIEGGYIHLATDGSAGDGRMSFAWKACNKEEKTLVQHAGQAFGKESLFWSEAYGVLSV
eukprot:2043511-Ditylum_brightwellii.AAC.1